MLRSREGFYRGSGDWTFKTVSCCGKIHIGPLAMNDEARPDDVDDDGDERSTSFERLAEIWGEQTRAAGEIYRTMLDASTVGESIDPESDPHWEPKVEAVHQLQRWVEVTGQMSEALMLVLSSLLESVRGVDDDESLRSPSWHEMWEEHFGQLSELPPEMAERLSRADPERLTVLLGSMAQEYLNDLDALGSRGMEIDLRPVAQALDAVAAGDADDEAQRVVERLRHALIAKARYSPEYFAEPGSTPTGQTPRELIHGVGRIRLYRYLPPPEADAHRRGDPVLIVYSIINRPTILDLMPGYSFVEHLLAEGLDVYLIDWGEFEPGDQRVTLDSYIEPGIRRCVEVIEARTGAEKVSLFGHCIGGNLALLYAATHPEEVARLVTLTTPITAAKGGVVALWTDKNVFPLDSIIDEYGFVPGKLIRYTFIALKPYYEMIRWKRFLEHLGDDDVMELFFAVDRWANDNIDLPGEVFRKFATEVFHADRFRRGSTVVAGRRADLSAITCPLLNIAAERDWIVPPESVEPLNNAVNSDEVRFMVVGGGHVSLLVEPRHRVYWKEISDFLLAV